MVKKRNTKKIQKNKNIASKTPASLRLKGGNNLSDEMIKIFIRNYTYEEKDQKIKELIERGFDINNQIVYNSSPGEDSLNTLFFACHLFCIHNNQTNYNIQVLLENGADINFRNSNNDTPLLFCLKHFKKCNSKLYNLIDFLIDEGADVNSVDDLSNTPLHLACAYDDFELIRLLLDSNNIDINAANVDNDSPLLIYCRDNQNFNVENFNYFVSKGADINVMNDEDENLLTAISFNCNYEGAVNLFNQENYDINIDILNQALEDVKTCYDNIEKNKFIELLIEKGAEVELIDIPHSFDEELPLLCELKPPENLEIVETISNVNITEGFDFYQYDNVNIDEFIKEYGDNALVFYLKLNDNEIKAAVIYKREQLINGYNDRSNIFYKCIDFNKKNNFKDNVVFHKPYYKLQVGQVMVYILLKDLLKIVKSSHKFWIISENKHDTIKSLCSRANLFSGEYNEEGYAVNYDDNVINLVSGFHCEVNRENTLIDFYEGYDTKIYESITVNNERKLRKFKFTPFFSYTVKPTERIVKNKKTPPQDTGSPKGSPPSSPHTRKRKTPSPPRKTKKQRS
jgi:ankyrin repeat protein